MKRLLILALALTIPLITAAEEISFNLDRCVLVNNQGDQLATPWLAMDFTIPSELTDEEIMYAELTFTIPAISLAADSLMEICLYPFLEEWSENDIDTLEMETAVDSLSAGCFTVKMGEVNSFHIDLTLFFRNVLEGRSTNYGFIVIPELLNRRTAALPEDLDQRLLDTAAVQAVYK